jgi:hypothetical protein
MNKHEHSSLIGLCAESPGARHTIAQIFPPCSGAALASCLSAIVNRDHGCGRPNNGAVTVLIGSNQLWEG